MKILYSTHGDIFIIDLKGWACTHKSNWTLIGNIEGDLHQTKS